MLSLPLFLICALLFAGCAREAGDASLPHSFPKPGEKWLSTNLPLAVTMAHVVRRIPHDTRASTQGFFFRNGEFIESTGLRGHSTIRRVDALSGETRKMRHLDPYLFGEGCAPTPSDIVALTWRNRVALRYDINTLDPAARLSYPREGWGLTFDGERLLASDGTDALYALDPVSLETLDTIHVRTADGKAVSRLNELEWVNSMILANVFPTDLVVAIDPGSGIVACCWDFSAITRHEAPTKPEHVLNGIAHDTQTGRLWITGKCWNHIYEVRPP